MSGRRARIPVVTGMGVVAPGGLGIGPFWDLMSNGRTATRRVTLFDPEGFRCQVAAECDFDPVALGLTPQEVRRMDRVAQMAVVASREALADSGLVLDDVPPDRVAVAIGNAVGNTIMMEQEYAVVSDGGRKWLTDWEYAVPYSYNYMVPSSLAAEIAVGVGAEGPVSVVSTGCTSGLDAVGYAARLIEEGSADVVVCGAADAPISPITMACFDALRATTPNNSDPGHACRPFDRQRDGIVLGEGAAVFVMEEREHARRRMAAERAVLLGYAGRANAYHMTGLKEDGRELSVAIDTALADAGVDVSQVDYINAHGSGTRQNDRHETAAVKRSFRHRAREVPMSSVKSMIGHSLGAIGAIEVAASILAIEHDLVPPTANLEHADPECDLDYVPNTARETPVDVVLSVGSGFGGFQTAVVLGAGEAVPA
ncbi:beta-ketoacyl-[acyl-carrier-protein] synthase family protein [Sinosporangium siamense]|uniref:Beta-ACP synthase n=1 Tax=Sinosporangium siamense TaxID=1367973 RepID=A0A919VEF7_9ACTN|nr:beta-ketoacyl-[acyl-carrier-protein] synthase family protein [Sinosporangium siamense]GII95074.1 beta-ACP synthase [Sinosporangium siamense]